MPQVHLGQSALLEQVLQGQRGLLALTALLGLPVLLVQRELMELLVQLELAESLAPQAL